MGFNQRSMPLWRGWGESEEGHTASRASATASESVQHKSQGERLPEICQRRNATALTHPPAVQPAPPSSRRRGGGGGAGGSPDPGNVAATAAAYAAAAAAATAFTACTAAHDALWRRKVLAFALCAASTHRQQRQRRHSASGATAEVQSAGIRFLASLASGACASASAGNE